MNCLSYPQGILVVASDNSLVYKKNEKKLSLLLSSDVERNNKNLT